MNLTINGQSIKAKTLVILGAIASGALISQITAVNHFLSYHPRLAPLGGFVISALTLLHEPWVQNALNIKVPDGSTADVNIHTPASGRTAK